MIWAQFATSTRQSIFNNETGESYFIDNVSNSVVLFLFYFFNVQEERRLHIHIYMYFLCVCLALHKNNTNAYI
jgi:hypothetical protein